MKVKVLFALFITLILSASFCNAATGEYTLTFDNQNHWVAQKDIQPVRDLIIDIKDKPSISINATCSSLDNLCTQRIEILNHILKTQKVSQQVKNVSLSKKLNKNTIKLSIAKLDPSKYDIQFINYQNKNIRPIVKSERNIKKLLDKAELKYLSQFRFYCNKNDNLCKNRFDYINQKIAKSLTFKYNISLAINPKLKTTQTALAAYRHDYNFVPKEVTIKKQAYKPKTIQKPINYTNNPYVIVFATNSAVLSPKEKRKIEKIIKENSSNKFYFACNRAQPDLCEVRVREIKFHALTATDNLIELYQLEESVPANYIVIKKQ